AFFAIYALAAETATKTEIKTKTETKSIPKRSNLFLAGFFAGSAAACKYPAMLFVVVPIGIYLFIVLITTFNTVRIRTRMVFVLIYGIGILLACGGWYFKNYYYTGNPVYPLCFSIFGDSTGSWNAEVDARWTRIHSPHDFYFATFINDFWRVGLSSSYNAPLTIPFFLLVFVVKTQWEKRRILWLLIAWLVFVFATWWLLTHRIDRFWLPAIPVLTLLSGVGATWCTQKLWKTALTILMILSCVYCFLLSGAPSPGKNNRFFASLNSMRHDPNISTPYAVWFNTHPPEDQEKILLVGEAKAFLYEVPVLYNSCFDETPLKDIVTSTDPALEFQRRHIAFVVVDWSEITRFRSPGNYGYSESVQPEVFNKLVTDGILERYCPTEELARSPTVGYRVRNCKTATSY
ncbi:MAG: hypothetical protein LBQ50_06095, partial [Planctomycetaceae bacterium]|nr:hypothetical protein [Planctomycetaceae bacterium]